MTSNRTIRLTVVDTPGVLLRIVLIFTRRGLNIDTIETSTLENKYSQITIQAAVEKNVFEHILKKLTGLIDVIDCECIESTTKQLSTEDDNATAA